MIKIRAMLPATFKQRCRKINAAAHAVRQQAVQGGGDLNGWKLSRLMRDADTNALVKIAELKYGVWLETNLIMKEVA